MSMTLPPGYRPTDREQFMNPLQQEYFKQKLLKWKQELINESNQTLASLQEESLSQPDLADRATASLDENLDAKSDGAFFLTVALAVAGREEPVTRAIERANCSGNVKKLAEAA